MNDSSNEEDVQSVSQYQSSICDSSTIRSSVWMKALRISIRILCTLVLLALFVWLLSVVLVSPKGGWFYWASRKQKLLVHGQESNGNFHILDISHNCAIIGEVVVGSSDHHHVKLRFSSHQTVIHSSHTLSDIGLLGSFFSSYWTYDGMSSKSVCLIDFVTNPILYPSLLTVNDTFAKEKVRYSDNCISYTTDHSTVCLRKGVLKSFRLSASPSVDNDMIPDTDYSKSFEKQKIVPSEIFDTHINRFCSKVMSQKLVFEAIEHRDGLHIERAFNLRDFLSYEFNNSTQIYVSDSKSFTVDIETGDCSVSTLDTPVSYLVIKDHWLAFRHTQEIIHDIDCDCFSNIDDRLCIDSKHGYLMELCQKSSCSSFSNHSDIDEDDGRFTVPHAC
ncbi:hypothetical protein GEMRC1_012671 [Eukaryota sp. GEM-RC1]